MDNKKLIIDFTEEQGNYLQRLGVEVDTKVFLIDRMFANHAADTDTALFDSVPFQHYMKQYEEAVTAWEFAKEEFRKNFLEPKVKEITGLENPNFNWAINDYLSQQCEVTLV